jgi:uncharacterized membrane protein YeaQ/YmgE (transglycosylase-associated protein family)
MDIHDLEKGCLLPLAQSGVTGALIGLAILALVLVNQGPMVTAWLAAMLAGSVGAVLVWLLSLVQWRRVVYAPMPLPEAVYEVEPLEPIRVEVKDERSGASRFAFLPATPEQLQALARGLLDGATFAESYWTGSGQPFTRAEFSSLRAELLKRGLLAWNNPAAPARGASLTPAGRAVMRHAAGEAVAA